MNIPKSKLPRIVIISSGFARVSMAKVLANRNVSKW